MMLNRYRSRCHFCNKWVETEQGVRSLISYPVKVYATKCKPCYYNELKEARDKYKLLQTQDNQAF